MLTHQKVNTRLISAVTHVIFKSGLKSTMDWYRRQEPDEKPFIVGVGWLLKSKKGGERLDETEFTVDFAVEDVFQKVRHNSHSDTRYDKGDEEVTDDVENKEYGAKSFGSAYYAYQKCPP